MRQAAATGPGPEAHRSLARHPPEHDVLVLLPGPAAFGGAEVEHVPVRTRERGRRQRDREFLVVVAHARLIALIAYAVKVDFGLRQRKTGARVPQQAPSRL